MIDCSPETKFKFMARYSTLVTLLSFAFFFAAVFIPTPDDKDQFIGIILGFLMGTAVTAFINYFFGGSPSKTEPKPPIAAVGETSTVDSTVTKHTEVKPEETK
jgi:hypothetical protein